MTKITVLDTETTGLKQEKGARIIEIAFLTYSLETGELTDTWIKRFDPQCPIEPGAQAIHGISYSDLVGEPIWEDLAGEIAERMGQADLLVAHNMGFDGPFIAAELLRCGVAIPDVYSLCTMTSGRWACADGKSPTLGELAFALGVDYDTSKAHGAGYDTSVTAGCFFAGFKRGFYKLPNAMKSALDFDTLQERKVA